MTDDPHPEFRCRCVYVMYPSSPYYDRCDRRPTQEDGFCDQCRAVCQVQHSGRNVPLLTSCRAAMSSEVPF